jgi:hypothetical protein
MPFCFRLKTVSCRSVGVPRNIRAKCGADLMSYARVGIQLLDRFSFADFC